MLVRRLVCTRGSAAAKVNMARREVRTRGHAVAINGRNPLAAGQLLHVNVVMPLAAGRAEQAGRQADLKERWRMHGQARAVWRNGTPVATPRSCHCLPALAHLFHDTFRCPASPPMLWSMRRCSNSVGVSFVTSKATSCTGACWLACRLK